MPFESKAQQRFMFAKHPRMAKRWADHTPDIKSLPEKKMKKKASEIADGVLKCATELTEETREEIPTGEFALPGRRYPIHDKAHAENALARVAQHGTPEERKTVRQKVYAKYPELKKNFEEREGESPTSKENVKKEKLGTDQRGNVSDTKLRTATRPNDDSPLFQRVRVTTARSGPETKPISDGTEEFMGVTKISTAWAKRLLDRYKVADSAEEEEREEAAMNPVTLEQVTEFIRENPSPEDHELHAWAEGLGVSPHAAEELLYQLAAQQVTGRPPEDTVEGGPEEEKEAAATCGSQGDTPNRKGLTKKQLKMKNAPPKIAKEIIEGGLADKKPDSKYPKEQIDMGVEVEKEHTPNAAAAKEIAKDHLEEHPKYYTHLERMEKKLEKQSELDPAFRAGFEETINANMEGPKLSPRESDKSLAQKVAEALLEKAAYQEEGGVNPLLTGALGGLGGLGYGTVRGGMDWDKYLKGGKNTNRQRMWESIRGKSFNPERLLPQEKALVTKYTKHMGQQGIGKKGLMGAGLGLLGGILLS
jgi:hypothetical protein